MTDEDKKVLYKKNETNIRQCLGEAVPTEVMRQIAERIRIFFISFKPHCSEKKIITDYELTDFTRLCEFVRDNPLNLDIQTLTNIAEISNSNRFDHAAFYTNRFLINEIMGILPNFSKPSIRILEPSVGVGTFIPFLIKRYSNYESVIIDAVDIDSRSLNVFNSMLKHFNIPSNVKINLIHGDFLTLDFEKQYDLVVGNPPFSKINNSYDGLSLILSENHNKKTRNLSEFFLEKAVRISNHVALVLNKTILSSDEFAVTRSWLRNLCMESIIDFGRFGFTGRSIETICLSISSKTQASSTMVINLKHNIRKYQRQEYITSPEFPYFLIYRDSEFDRVASKMDLGVFNSYRDRQITKSNTDDECGTDKMWVLKAKNISKDGQGVVHIDGYDRYIDRSFLKELTVSRYINDHGVYLTPNMTYTPRLIENVDDVVPDGSVAVLIPIKDIRLSKKQLDYYLTDEYRKFFFQSRNYSTQSINVDCLSVFFYGVLKDGQ